MLVKPWLWSENGDFRAVLWIRNDFFRTRIILLLLVLDPVLGRTLFSHTIKG
jgi:hypothetical protein